MSGEWRCFFFLSRVRRLSESNVSTSTSPVLTSSPGGNIHSRARKNTSEDTTRARQNNESGEPVPAAAGIKDKTTHGVRESYLSLRFENAVGILPNSFTHTLHAGTSNCSSSRRHRRRDPRMKIIEFYR